MTSTHDTINILITQRFKSFILNSSSKGTNQSFIQEYKPQQLSDNQNCENYDDDAAAVLLQHLSLCLIQPKFQYIPHNEKTDQKVLRLPQTFLSPKVIEKIEEIKALQQLATNSSNTSSGSNSQCRSPPPPRSLSLFDQTYQSPVHDGSSSNSSNKRQVLILHIQMEDLISSNDSPSRDEILKSNWTKQIIDFILLIRTVFDPQYCRIICLMGAGLRQSLSHRNTRMVDDFVAELAIKYTVDVQWTTSKETDAVEWIKRTIKAVEECENRPIPSAFRSRGKSSTNRKSVVHTAEIRWLDQLIQIPGIQREKAKAIMTEFKTPFALIEHFRDPSLDLKEKIQRLASIRVPSVQKSDGRQLGEAFAMRIYRLYNPNANPMGWVLRD